MTRGRIGILALLLTAALVRLSAQPLDRLSGKVIGEHGEPIRDADIRVEAIFGFAGSDFLGQRTFSTRTNAKGEWALLAFKSGITRLKVQLVDVNGNIGSMAQIAIRVP